MDLRIFLTWCECSSVIQQLKSATRRGGHAARDDTTDTITGPQKFIAQISIHLAIY